MSRFATPIDLLWGGTPAGLPPASAAESRPPASPEPEAFPPQLLYPSSAPNEAPPPPAAPPAPPVAVQPSSRTDTLVMVLAAVVVLLLLFIVHLNSKLNSLQMMVTFMASRSGAPLRP